MSRAPTEKPLLCECCGEKPAGHWMEWGEWLCEVCCQDAIDQYAECEQEAAQSAE